MGIRVFGLSFTLRLLLGNCLFLIPFFGGLHYGYILIFDPYGREVHHQPLLQPDTEISLGGLVKGMYIYEVITDDYKSYGKLWVE